MLAHTNTQSTAYRSLGEAKTSRQITPSKRTEGEIPVFLAKAGEKHETDYVLHRWSCVEDARLFSCLASTHSIIDV